MKEELELAEHIYKDASMAEHTLMVLLEDLKDKDNKIKGYVEDILKEYQTFLKASEELLTKEGQVPKKEGFMAKMMSTMGINKEVSSDNSDVAIADMLIQGISMGAIEMEKKISAYKKDLSKEQLSLAKKFLQFQEKTIDHLKEYL